MLYYTCLYETFEGVNTMNQLKSFRRIALLVLVVAGVLTIAACSSSEKHHMVVFQKMYTT